MFSSTPLTGNDLPDKTICLTFDDGPGETSGNGPSPRTLELARFLADRAIPATFFMIGNFADTQRSTIQEVAKLGHLIGNHTFNHPGVASLQGAAVEKELFDTHSIISPAQGCLKLFRAPYGDWSSSLAGHLNWTPARCYIGHIGWDIDCGDFAYWGRGESAKQCADAYVAQISGVGRGIVLMHDSSWEEPLRRGNLTLEAVKLIVNELTRKDYLFVGLDSLPQIRRSARVSSLIALEASTGLYISPQEGGGREVLVDGPRVGNWEPLGVVELGDDKIALRCLSGHYLSAQQGGGGGVRADGPKINDWEVLTQITPSNGASVFQCPNGSYLCAAIDGSNRLLATASNVTDATAFRIQHPPTSPW